MNLLFRRLPMKAYLNEFILSKSTYSTTNSSEANDAEAPELDDLIKKLIVNVKGHDRSVLDSYTKFMQMTATELNVNLTEIREPHRFIERWSLLKSKFGNRKHMRQYEMRTYFREFEFKYLTGSTCDTLLEYVERNLPEGVAMHVQRTKILPVPEHFKSETKPLGSKAE
jgi:small subunit ribosomal protein S10